MMKVTGTRSMEERIRLLERSVNFSEVILPFPAIGADVTIAFGVLTGFGGLAVDRSVFRRLLPDDRWVVYAAGWATTSDANTVTLTLRYELDNGTTAILGTITHTGARTKKAMGPFDVWPTVGVPRTETIPMVRLFAIKNVAGTAELENWNLWVRFVAPRQS